jgi:hypothetical protein
VCYYRWTFSLNRDALTPGEPLTFRVETADPTGRYLSEPSESPTVLL